MSQLPVVVNAASTPSDANTCGTTVSSTTTPTATTRPISVNTAENARSMIPGRSSTTPKMVFIDSRTPRTTLDEAYTASRMLTTVVMVNALADELSTSPTSTLIADCEYCEEPGVRS